MAEYTLPDLAYDYSALAPSISGTIMELHHGKHHQAYIDNLNKALADQPELAAKSVEDLLRGFAGVPDSIKTAVRNHGGGHANHSLFWESMGPSGQAPGSTFLQQVTESFGTLAGLQKAMQQSAEGLFGSGWMAWSSS